MNAEHSVCASSDLAKRWDGIVWSRCEREVRRLQARIVKAVQRNQTDRLCPTARLHNGLSRMRGNSPVRF